MNIFKKIPAVIASVAVIVSLSAVAVSANSYVSDVSDVVTEDVEVVFDSATKAQREQAQQIIADYIAKNIPNGIADVSKMDKVAAYVRRSLTTRAIPIRILWCSTVQAAIMPAQNLPFICWVRSV